MKTANGAIGPRGGFSVLDPSRLLPHNTLTSFRSLVVLAPLFSYYLSDHSLQQTSVRGSQRLIKRLFRYDSGYVEFTVRRVGFA